MSRRRGDYEGDQDKVRVQGSSSRGFNVIVFCYGIRHHGEGFRVWGFLLKAKGIGLQL